ncbi:MAG: translation elongation factor Ts [Acidimicrobiia bacterium]
MAASPKDIKALRDATGAGMMDCKKALEESGNDIDAAMALLREKGLTKAKERVVGTQGTVALAIDGNRGALVELKSETDFVAGSDQFKAFVQELADLVLAKGEGAVAERSKELEDLKVLLKEGIDIGTVARIEAAAGNVLGTYLHIQGGRGVNGVLVELSGSTEDQAREIALHISFAKPKYVRRDEVPADVIERERTEAEAIARGEGKPEAALPKIIEGRVNGYFKDVCLTEQGYIRDDKQSVKAYLGGGDVVRFAQAFITG